MWVVIGLFIGTSLAGFLVRGPDARLSLTGTDVTPSREAGGPTFSAAAPPGGRWTNAFPWAPSRYYHAMAYSSRADRTVVFGGLTAHGVDADTWVYEWASNTWTYEDPGVRPSPRANAAMAYDEGSDRFVLFGGEGYFSRDETWVYDLSADTWTMMAPTVHPDGRFWAAMAYDARVDRIILFGGHMPDGGLAPIENDETWAYDVDNDTWTNLNPVAHPTGRYLHAMTYDSRAGRTILEGGKVPCSPNPIPNPSCISGETWTFDYVANAWRQVAPGPGRLDHAIAYDAGSDRTVLFGGNSGSTEALGETWLFDLATNQWTNAVPPVSAPPLYGHRMAYDPRADKVVLFAGYQGNVPAVLWAYDTDANAWAARTPPPHPNFRSGHAMAYDPRGDRVVLFGGYVGGANGETWAYDTDTQTWVLMAPRVSPSPRMNSAMVYDPGTGTFILFGGDDGTFDYNDETWSYDLGTNTWTDLRPATSPPPRRGHAMAYDEGLGRVVLFGGEVSGQFRYGDDTWLYDPRANEWTRAAPSTSPPARTSHAMAYDARSRRTVLTEGEVLTRPYSANDTWTYDGTMNTWRNVTSASGPSARGGSAAVYDPLAGRIILFGGASRGQYEWTQYDETWVYDSVNGSWLRSVVSPHPSARSFPALAYDSGSDRTVLYGGQGSDETWTYEYVAPLDVALRAEPGGGPAPLDVAFFVDVSGGTPPYSFAWDFGDGSTGTDRDPSHRYPSAGTYNVTVTVTESTGASASAFVVVSVSLAAAPPWVAAVILGVPIAFVAVFVAWWLRRKARGPPETP